MFISMNHIKKIRGQVLSLKEIAICFLSFIKHMDIDLTRARQWKAKVKVNGGSANLKSEVRSFIRLFSRTFKTYPLIKI